MKPGPAISGRSIQSEAGSAAITDSAILRGGAFSARELHRDVGRVVAVRGVARALEDHRRGLARRGDGGERLAEEAGEVGADFGGHGGACCPAEKAANYTGRASCPPRPKPVVDPNQ